MVLLPGEANSTFSPGSREFANWSHLVVLLNTLGTERLQALMAPTRVGTNGKVYISNQFCCFYLIYIYYWIIFYYVNLFL